jgi:hypothetical protein
MPLLETKGAGSAQGFGLSLGGEEAVYIEDVFSTYLYTTNNSTQTITNGIDLAGEGGLMWFKPRNDASNTHALIDSIRGNNAIYSSLTNAQDALVVGGGGAGSITLNSDGFSFSGSVFSGQSNLNNGTTTNMVSWTFRKQPKFFDVVTYTGNGTAGRTVAHSLGSVPGCIIVKRTNAANGWAVYHRAMDVSAPQDWMMRLNSTDARFDLTPSRWNDTAPTSTVFTLSGNDEVNGSGDTYVAYLFAHDAGGFGLEGTDNVISCGSFTTDGSTNATINLGWEPQWILTKDTGAADDWRVSDNMRGLGGIGSGSVTARLVPNTSGAENSATGDVKVFATGANISLNASRTYIYIAIRRGPMKVPTDATKVFNSITRTGTGSTANITGAGFPPDMIFNRNRGSGYETDVNDKLRGAKLSLFTPYTQAEGDLGGTGMTTIGQDGCTVATDTSYNQNGGSFVLNFFKRAPGFFDEVCYTGTGVAGLQVTHNLTVIPELLIVKRRSSIGEWDVYNSTSGATKYLELNATAASATGAHWNNTTPTSTYFTVNDFGNVNASGGTYVAYLFATLAGVSKVGSYTGNGSSQTINCGFTGGARLVLIKRTDSTGDWYVWDSSRGIVAGNDPHLSLNTTAAEVTTDDSVDTDSTGFVVNQVAATNVNVTSATYIFLAIA